MSNPFNIPGDKVKKVFPENPENNQMFYWTVQNAAYVYREDYGAWLPLVTIDLTPKELSNLKVYIEDYYPEYHDSTDDTDVLAARVGATLTTLNIMTKKNRDKLVNSIQRMKLQETARFT